MKSPTHRLLLLLFCWGGAAFVFGAFKLLTFLFSPAVPMLIASLTVGFSVGIWRITWLRSAVEALSIRIILSAHLVRFIGFYFLWLHAQGRLPVEFAQRAGWGDIVAASGALALLFWPEGAGFKRGLFWWNLIGATDLLFAVGTGGWLNSSRPGSMRELAELPLVLVPLWLVPVLLSSHLYLIRMHCKSVGTHISHDHEMAAVKKRQLVCSGESSDQRY